MSWFNGQILKPTELAAAAGLDFRTTYGFGQEVKLWLENGEHYNSIPATVAGVSVGAQGSVQYKLALAIGDTGLFTTVEIPAGWITSKDVQIFNGPPDQVDAEELRNYMGQGKPQLELVRKPAWPVGMGQMIKRDYFAIFDQVSTELGDVVHEAVIEALAEHNRTKQENPSVDVMSRTEGIIELRTNGRTIVFSTGLGGQRRLRVDFVRNNNPYPLYTIAELGNPNTPISNLKRILFVFLTTGDLRRESVGDTPLYPSASVEVKGIHIKREGFAIFDKNNKALGDAVHQAMVATVQRWIERYQSFEYGDIRVVQMGVKEIEVKFREIKAVFTYIESNSFNLVIFNKAGARLHTYSYSMEELGIMIHMLVDNFCPPN